MAVAALTYSNNVEVLMACLPWNGSRWDYWKIKNMWSNFSLQNRPSNKVDLIQKLTGKPRLSVTRNQPQIWLHQEIRCNLEALYLQYTMANNSYQQIYNAFDALQLSGVSRPVHAIRCCWRIAFCIQRICWCRKLDSVAWIDKQQHNDKRSRPNSKDQYVKIRQDLNHVEWES